MQKGRLQANCVVCNLEQNPLRRPIASAWLPALLKSGVMWGIRRDGGTANTEERYLLESESTFELRYDCLIVMRLGGQQSGKNHCSIHSGTPP